MNGKIKKENLMFVIIIGIALGTRQLAMNIVTPFVAEYATSLIYGTVAIGGIALGIFSLTQGFFQVPFGGLYDKIGGKKVILIGLGLLVLGLFLSYASDNSYIYVLSRALQGSGAITSASYSWVSRKVSVEERANSISLIGVFIGLASAIALGGGPLLIKFISVKTLYLVSTIIVFLVFLFVLFFLKEDKFERKEKVKINAREYIKSVFKNRNFILFSFIAFIFSYIGIAAFFIIPEHLEKMMGLDNIWKILTPTIILAIVAMRISTKFLQKGYVKEVVKVATTLLVLGGIILAFNRDSVGILFVISLFLFGGYTMLSALVPTIVNLIAKDEFRGLLNGVVNGIIYMGSFIGATLSGLLYSNHIEVALVIILILAIISVMAAYLINLKKLS